MAMMEGTLWKWTNYLSGWQPRWFVLEVGVLAYYKSQEEVGLGSRGSIKMACCEITVHPSDQVRIDLKIPPEQRIYLRAATPAERQQWVVALGTAKACITNVERKRTGSEVQKKSVNQLKDKMGELSMYRSLLLQQINTIKLLCTSKEENQEFSEAATMLSATCDEFLKNLCDCMELADSNFNASPTSPTASTMDKQSSLSSFRKELLHEPHSHRTASPPPSPTSSISSSTISSSLNGVPSIRAPSEHSTSSDKTSSSRQNKRHGLPAAPAHTHHSSSDSSETNSSGLQSVRSSDSSLNTATTSSRDEKQLQTSQSSLGSSSLQPGEVKDPDLPTFFSLAQYKFEDIRLTAEGHIPTKPFLNACNSIVPFFDMLGSTAFAPVKLDIAGNIKKLLAKHDTDHRAFVTLQNVVYQELKSNSHGARGSATDALLWLKRALEFMQIFLSEVVKGEKDLAVAAGTAYGKTLRRYHGWVVRGVFALAVKAVPYRGDFLTALGTTEHAVAPPKYVLQDIKLCTTALGAVTNNINLFYRKHGLDNDATV